MFDPKEVSYKIVYYICIITGVIILPFYAGYFVARFLYRRLRYKLTTRKAMMKVKKNLDDFRESRMDIN